MAVSYRLSAVRCLRNCIPERDRRRQTVRRETADRYPLTAVPVTQKANPVTLTL